MKHIGIQLYNILLNHLLNKQDFSSYKYIIYGFTPNDLFDLVDGSSIKDGTVSIVKKLLLSTATSKFLLHNLMRLDKVYLDLYLSRQPYAGYLESPLSGKYENAIDIAFSQLSELENNIKRKLIIVLLPQEVEVLGAGGCEKEKTGVGIGGCWGGGNM